MTKSPNLPRSTIHSRYYCCYYYDCYLEFALSCCLIVRFQLFLLSSVQIDFFSLFVISLVFFRSQYFHLNKNILTYKLFQ